MTLATTHRRPARSPAGVPTPAILHHTHHLPPAPGRTPVTATRPSSRTPPAPRLRAEGPQNGWMWLYGTVN